VLSDDCLLSDRTGLPRSRRCCASSSIHSFGSRQFEDVGAAVRTSRWWHVRRLLERRKALETCGVKVLIFDGPGGRTDMRRMVECWAAKNGFP